MVTTAAVRRQKKIASRVVNLGHTDFRRCEGRRGTPCEAPMWQCGNVAMWNSRERAPLEAPGPGREQAVCRSEVAMPMSLNCGRFRVTRTLDLTTFSRWTLT